MKLQKLECFCAEVLEFHKRLVQSQFIGVKAIFMWYLLTLVSCVGVGCVCVRCALILHIHTSLNIVPGRPKLRLVPGSA